LQTAVDVAARNDHADTLAELLATFPLWNTVISDGIVPASTGIWSDPYGEHHVWPLHSAARYGSVRAVHVLLEAGASVSAPYDGCTAVEVAAYYGHLACVQLLLVVRARVPERRRQDMHNLALGAAALSGQRIVVEWLLHAGADVEANGPFHGPCRWKTPLTAATEKGHVDVIEVLLQAKADPRNVPRNMAPAVDLAVSAGCVDAIALLAAAKADVRNRHKSETYSPLGLAAQLRHPRAACVAKALLRCKASVNAAASQLQFTPLRVAVTDGNIRMVKFLVRAKADVDKSGTGTLSLGSPLWASVRCGHADAVQVLLAAKADVECDCNGPTPTPLFDAVSRGSVRIAALLIEGKADIRRTRVDGTAPLHVAVNLTQTRVEMVQLLLASKADANVARRTGRKTPLALAVQQGCGKTAQALVDARADVHNLAKPRMWESLLVAAVENVRFKGRDALQVVEVLLRAGADMHCGKLRDVVFKCEYAGRAKLCRLLLSAKVSL